MKNNAGVTLMEMLVVVFLVGLLASISFPAVSSGVDSLRLNSASDAVASFLNSALNRAERRQQVMEIAASKEENKLTMRSTEKGFLRELNMPQGVTVQTDARVVLFPGGTVPRIGVMLANRRGAKRLIRVDPIVGIPEIETPKEQ
ncbi:MAG: prepilin-type N-terminal cleavage/methylation domain-containing protein [Candidatus Solibacter usitatus]|nr:prepilin-type N-terminal cleavage/methylation domain-containing protein [Candidatus Solibacter usitatus]